MSSLLSGSFRLAGDGEEELLDDLLELDRVEGQVAQALLELLGGRADERASGLRPDLVGQPLVEELQLLVGVLESLRVHVTPFLWGARGSGG
jgi:hypothetical protein